MLYVTDKGRLCNNIFQYANVYAWAREHGRKAVSLRFAYKYRYFHICHTPHHHLLTYLWVKALAKLGLITEVDFCEKNRDYTAEEHLMMEKKQLVVKGWFVRYPDLLLKYKDEILQLFRFNERFANRLEQRYGLDNKDSLNLGVHIRRGDYSTWSQGRYFFGDHVYIDMIRQFAYLHTQQPLHVFITTNDHLLNSDLYRQSLPDVDITFADGSPEEDLYLLSRQHFLIGPPSTFTLVASMYGKARLHWMTDARHTLAAADFAPFEQRFTEFDSLFIPAE